MARGHPRDETRGFEVTAREIEPRRRPAGRGRRLVAVPLAIALSTAACNTSDDRTASGPVASVDAPIEFRDRTGPHVDEPDRAMAMTVDAVDVDGDDILVRIRVENSDDGYLDMGVKNTIYAPLLVMRDDHDNSYESYAVEPAGIPGRRIADLSFRLAGPLDPAAETVMLELATQRGPLTSPTWTLPDGDGVRWRVGEASPSTPTLGGTNPDGSEPLYAAAPRLPDLIHFWLETAPLSADS